MKQAKNKDANIAAHLRGVIDKVQVTEEKLVTTASSTPKIPGAKTQIRNQSKSSFEFGVPDNGEIRDFQIKIHYSVSLSLADDNLPLCELESKTVAVFQLQSKGGFDKWADIPPEVLTPYFAFVHYLIRQRASEQLSKAGFSGIKLSTPESLKLQPSATESPMPIAVSGRPRTSKSD